MASGFLFSSWLTFSRKARCSKASKSCREVEAVLGCPCSCSCTSAEWLSVCLPCPRRKHRTPFDPVEIFRTTVTNAQRYKVRGVPSYGVVLGFKTGAELGQDSARFFLFPVGGRVQRRPAVIVHGVHVGATLQKHPSSSKVRELEPPQMEDKVILPQCTAHVMTRV